MKNIRNSQYLRVATPPGRMQNLLSQALWRAKKRGLSFDRDLFIILPSNPPLFCACCGREIDYSLGRKRNRKFSPSLDRINNEEGYTVKNVRVVCFDCNDMKSNHTIETLEMLLRYVKGTA